MGDVGTTKIFENEKNILWKLTPEPGEETPLHTHSHDYVFHVLDGAPLKAITATVPTSVPSMRPQARHSD